MREKIGLKIFLIFFLKFPFSFPLPNIIQLREKQLFRLANKHVVVSAILALSCVTRAKKFQKLKVIANVFTSHGQRKLGPKLVHDIIFDSAAFQGPPNTAKG